MSGKQPLHLVVATIAKYGFLAVYGEDIATDFKARGLLIANESSASNPIRYEGYDPDRQIATIDLTIDPKVPAVSGTVTAGSEQKTITASTIPGYQFDLAASLAAIAGHWELTTSQGRQIALNVDAAGIITGTSGPCSLYESKLVPTKTGYGVFAINLRFRNGNHACDEPHGRSDGVSGFAVVYSPLAGGAQLVVGAQNGWDPVFLAASGKR